MNEPTISRKDLDNEQFIQLRKNTEKIAALLHKRLKSHLNILKPLFNPIKLLGAYIKSAGMDDVPGSDKVFARLQEEYAAVCETPFGLSRKLPSPLTSMTSQIDATPYKYTLYMGNAGDKATTITAPTRWILSYQSDCPYDRMRDMVQGVVSRQPEELKSSLIKHLVMFLLLQKFTDLTRLLQDLRYEVEFKKCEELGGLPLVLVKAPIESFLPSNEFIANVTQLSGIPAFQEIIDVDAPENMPDPLKESLKAAVMQ
ncbi:MAG: hypothetical protein R6T92_06380 [Desulfosalsimonadaceae bacterium]